MHNKGMFLHIINLNKRLKTLRISQKGLLPVSNKKLSKIVTFKTYTYLHEAIELIRDNSLQMLSNSCLEGELTNDDGTKCVYPQDVCTLNHECPNPKSLL